MTCASCATDLPAAAKFCLECGAPVAAGAVRSAPPATTAASPSRTRDAGGARKVVSIVFADLVGSTALHERLDPEAARAFVEGYYAAMRGAVEAHGGVVTQLLGDGVKAMFGVPRVGEDDALRAVRAAVAMQAAFRELATRSSARVGKSGLRIAVNTGEVVVSDDSEVIGDPVNVAARLQEQGRDGDVVVGDATARLVGAHVTLVPLGTFSLKGRAEPVAAFRVESLARPEGTAAAPFVGRDDELARLTAVHDAAIATPASRLIVLIGSPGLGKSRLIDEFVRRHASTARLIAAHCDAAGGATFAPLAAALRRLLAIEAGTSGAAVRAAVAAALPAHAAEEAEVARIAAGIAHLLTGSPAPPEETFFVVRRLLAMLAAVQPVLLVIDDLHWAEPLLLDLVEHLVQWGDGVPLLVLVGARPELRDTRASFTTPGGLVADVVTLAGLDAGAAMRLAASVIGATDLPAAIAAKVLATSEGNPLFVGELVRMLVHEGALRREGARWTADSALAALEMPPTIHAVLAARIERLAPDERAVLERAAVVGRHFSRSAVEALLPSGAEDVAPHLESLRRSELIEADAGSMLGEPLLRFHHVLIRDAAYRRILKGTRAALHARFAGWFASRAGAAPEHDETIGWHLEQAHQHLRELGPLDAEGRALGERASLHLAAAGRRALARDDVPLAAGLLGRAVATLDPDDATRADLALDWCEALLAAGDVAAAAGAIAELERFCAGSDRLGAWHACFAAQLKVLTAPEELRAAAGAVAAATARLTALDDAAGQATGHFVHALALARLGQVGACESVLDRALAAARRASDRRRANTVLAIAPLAALWGPSPVTRASGRCLDVVRVLRITQGAPAVEAVALSCQGVLEALRGRTDAARRMIASARKLVEELGITQRLLEADAFAGLVDLLDGDAASAERSLRGAYEGLRDLGLGIDAARAAALLGRALLALGRADEAEVLSHDSEALAGDDLKAAIAWRGVRAAALARRGAHATAVELARTAVEIAAATDALLDHADARVALATALRAANRGTEAEHEERRAIELWQAKGATLLVERAWPTAAQARASGESVSAGVTATGRAPISTRPLEPDPLSLRQAVVATLGDSLTLVRHSIEHDGAVATRASVGAVEADHFCLLEVDDREPRTLRSEVFAADRLADAIARLYQRHAELLPASTNGARAAAIGHTCAALLAFAASGDVEPLHAVVSADLEDVDHRQLGLPPGRGADAFLRALRALFDLAADTTVRTTDVLALEEQAVLHRVSLHGTDRRSGGAFELPTLLLWAFDDAGLLARWEVFDADDEAHALARFAEVARRAQRDTAPPHRAPRRRTMRRVAANAASAALARRPHPPDASTRPELLATLGDRLVLFRRWTGASAAGAEGHDPGPSAKEDLGVEELDAAGRHPRSESFTVDHLGDAVAWLYARHAASRPEGAPRSRMEATARAIAAMAAPPDLERYASALAPSVEFADHRTVGFDPGHGADALLRGFASLLELAPDVRTRVEDVLCLEPGALLLRWSTSGTDRRSGGTFESSFLLLWIFGADGRIVRDETFDADREAEALARLDELARATEPATPLARRVDANAAAALAARFEEAFAADDDATLGELFGSALQVVDHPNGATYGRDGHLASLRRLQQARDPVLRFDPLTTLGERLVLSRRHIHASATGRERFDVGAFEREEIVLLEVDDGGRCTHIEVFAQDHLGDAIVALYARYAATLPPGTERARAAAVARTLATATRPADLDAWCAAIPDAFELVDHRVLGVGALHGGEAMRANFRAMFALETRYQVDVVDVLATRPDALLARFGNSGVARDSGGTFERWFLQVVLLDRDGHIARMEYFDDDHDAAALARFDELDRRATIRPNAASRSRAQVSDAFLARDWDAMRALASAAMAYEDRRHWSRTRGGVEMWLASARTVQSAAGVELRDEILATFGERIELRRRILSGSSDGGAFESEFLLLTEVDAEGKLVASINFDAEAQDEACAEAQQRGLAIENVDPRTRPA